MTFISTLLKAAAALFMLVILMLLVQLDLTAFQTVEVLAPGWGWLAFVSLLALETGAVLWLGLAWFARAPRLVLRDDPTEADRQAFARELERRLKKNPHVRAAGLRATDEHFLEKALDVLDARAGEEIRNSAKRVFLGTALSQNGRLGCAHRVRLAGAHGLAGLRHLQPASHPGGTVERLQHGLLGHVHFLFHRGPGHPQDHHREHERAAARGHARPWRPPACRSWGP